MNAYIIWEAKMKTIKMILCDLDGTLLNANNTISDRTKKAIKMARNAGIIFGIATGRPPYAVLELIKIWDIDEDVDCIVGFNGAHILDRTLNESRLNFPISSTLQYEIMKHYENEPVNFMIYEPDGIYTQKIDAVSERLSRNNRLPRYELSEEILSHEHPKMLISCLKEDMERIEKVMETIHIENIRGVHSQPDLFEIFDARNSKSKGIEQIAKMHGYTLENVMAFGDEDNDLEMLRDCGVGVVMANGSAKALAIADEVTASNLDDGVAVKIENLFKKY